MCTANLEKCLFIRDVTFNLSGSPNMSGYYLLFVCSLVSLAKPGQFDSSTEGCFCEVSMSKFELV